MIYLSVVKINYDLSLCSYDQVNDLSICSYNQVSDLSLCSYNQRFTSL